VSSSSVNHSSKFKTNASQFDRRFFRSKVVSIDKSRFDRRQESVQSVSAELTIYQICLKIFSLAVDKRTKNNQALSLGFYHHLGPSYMVSGTRDSPPSRQLY